MIGLAQLLDQSDLLPGERGNGCQAQIIGTNWWVMQVLNDLQSPLGWEALSAVQSFCTNYSNHDCLKCARHCFNCFADIISLKLLIDPLREFIIPVLQMRKLRHEVVKQLGNLPKWETWAGTPGGLARNPTLTGITAAYLEGATHSTIKDLSQMPVCWQCSKV